MLTSQLFNSMKQEIVDMAWKSMQSIQLQSVIWCRRFMGVFTKNILGKLFIQRNNLPYTNPFNLDRQNLSGEKKCQDKTIPAHLN